MSNTLIADAMLALAPPWLADDSDDAVGGKYIFTLGLMSDALVEKMQQAVYARLPLGGTTSPSGGNGGPYQDALALLGADRVIVQGIGESALSYGRRLQRAFPTWQHAGQAITVMQEVLDYLQTQCRCAVVATPNAGLTAHATEFPAGANTDLPPARWLTLWDWETGTGINGAPGGGNGYDPHPLAIQDAWWRTWLVFWSVAPNAWTASEGNWGDPGLWGDDSASWGLSVPPSTVSTLQTLVSTWKCESAWYRWILVSLDADFINWSSGTAYHPSTGDWEHWSKIATATNRDGTTVPAYVPARDGRLRYCQGVST